MSIPDYQTLMLPMMQLIGDGARHRLRDLTHVLADEFGLTEDERRVLIPSGRQTVIASRTYWAKFYLSHALLLRSDASGVSITDRGRKVLLEAPARIDVAFLRQFPEFDDFIVASRRGRAPATTNIENSTTPREMVDASFAELRESLARELLDRLKQNSPEFFQEIVLRLLQKMNYGKDAPESGQVVGGPGDRGVDAIVQLDALGLDRVYVQAKRYGDNKVGSEAVRNFAGSLLQHKGTKGVLITTSSFSPEAEIAARSMDRTIVLIDGERLAELMIDFGVGVVDEQTYVIKRIDPEQFEI